MERKPENKYSLSDRVKDDLMVFEDWGAVAKDLENMAVGQRCFIYTHYPASGMTPPRIRAEFSRDSLNEALGERKDSYEMMVEESKEIKGGWEFSVRRRK